MTLPKSTWAESALPADVTDPPGGVRASGYQFEDALPHDELNSILRDLYRLSRSSGHTYETLEDAIDDPDLGTDPFTLYDEAQALSSYTARPSLVPALATVATGGNNQALASNGHYVIIARATGWYVVNTFTNARTYHTFATDVTAVAAGRDRYYVAEGIGATGKVTAYAYTDVAATPAVLSSYAHGQTISAMVEHIPNNVLITGVAGTGGSTVRYLDLSVLVGVATWSADRGATGLVCCSDGVRMYTGGGAGTDSATIERWGIVDNTRLAYQVSTAPNGGFLVTDGESLFFSAGAAPSDIVTTGNNLAFAAFVLLAGVGATAACVDDKNIYISNFASDIVYWIDKKNPTLRGLVGTGLVTDPVGVVEARGDTLWTIGQAGVDVLSFTKDFRPQRLRLRDATGGVPRSGPALYAHIGRG